MGDDDAELDWVGYFLYFERLMITAEGFEAVGKF